MKTLKKSILNGIFPVIGLILLIIFINSLLNVKKIQKNPEITTALIIDFKEDREWIHLVYKYSVNGVEYKKTDAHTFYKVNFSNFKNKRIPVVYQKNKPNRSYLLLSPNHFAKLGQPFPDSLKWLLEFE